MPAVAIVILVLAFVVAVCGVGVETLHRINRPSVQPPVPDPSEAEAQSRRITKAFGSDSQSTEIANLWFSLNEVGREELLFYGRSLVGEVAGSTTLEPVVIAQRTSGVMAKVVSHNATLPDNGDRATTLTPISVELVEAERDRPSKRPTMMIAVADMPRATVVESGTMCAICDMLISRNDSQASDGYGVTWHSRCLSQASKRPHGQSKKNGTQQ